MKKKLLGILGLVLMLVGAVHPAYAFAGTCEPVKFFGLDPWYAGLECDEHKNISQDNFKMDANDAMGSNMMKSVMIIIGTVVKDLLFFAGMAAVVLVMYGGILYILSSGNPAQVQKATKTISGALVGLIISILAYAITTTILTITGSN